MADRQLTYTEIDRIDRAVEESGLELVAAAGHRPRALRVRVPRARREAQLLAYVWRVRPGGGGLGVRPDDERRVQTTRPGHGDFATATGASTLLLGYDPEEDLYAAWDFDLRQWTRDPPGYPGGPPVKSPSAQTRQSKLEEASQTGLAFYVHDIDARQKDGATVQREESVANFRPDHLGAYLAWLDPKLVPSGRSAPARAFQRRRVAAQRLARDARFTKAIVQAYEARCCFCGLGGGIVEAAHIKPVADRGPDEIKNGVALCPNHHRLFDKGYLLISPTTFAVTANDRKLRADRVAAADRARIAADLADTPSWPSPALRPHPRYIRRHRKLHK